MLTLAKLKFLNLFKFKSLLMRQLEIEFLIINLYIFIKNNFILLKIML